MRKIRRMYYKGKKWFRRYNKARRLYIKLTLIGATLVAFWPMIEKIINK